MSTNVAMVTKKNTTVANFCVNIAYEIFWQKEVVEKSGSNSPSQAYTSIFVPIIRNYVLVAVSFVMLSAIKLTK